MKDNAVIITGASSGIGKELAFEYARLGARLSLAARDEKRLSEVAEACRKLDAEILVVPTDVSDEQACRHLIEATVKKFGRIDTLINNAAFGIKGHFEEYKDLKLFRSIMDVNFMGAVYCTVYALPYLKKSRGRIVAVSSILGKVTAPGNSAYCSSKFAMAGFFNVLRQELKGSGVSVTIIYPGLVKTEFIERMIMPDGSVQGESARSVFKKGVTMEAATCARKIIQAANKRKRELTLSFYGKAAAWLQFFSPRLLDRIVHQVNRVYRKWTG